MIDLKSWLTGFALGLCGKPLPFVANKQSDVITWVLQCTDTERYFQKVSDRAVTKEQLESSTIALTDGKNSMTYACETVIVGSNGTRFAAMYADLGSQFYIQCHTEEDEGEMGQGVYAIGFGDLTSNDGITCVLTLGLAA